MVDELKITRPRGGNRHPLSVRTFILERLAFAGEDYISHMHRLYKIQLDTLAAERNRRWAYHKPRYHSFEMAVVVLRREGLIEFSGKEEESDAPQFQGGAFKPMRRYYRLRR